MKRSTLRRALATGVRTGLRLNGEGLRALRSEFEIVKHQRKIAKGRGDVLLEFDARKIDNLYDFTYALRAHKPGDKVIVTVLRNGEQLTREVTLEARK
jgi:S1-C subfamily serine protease